ncbi:MAG: DUF1573 domain-containing protein [Bacteroidales bacterium]
MKKILLSITAAGALMLAISPAMGQKVVKSTDLQNKGINTAVINEETKSAEQAATVKESQIKEAGAAQEAISKSQQSSDPVKAKSAAPATNTNPAAAASVPLTCTWDKTTHDFGKEVEHLKPATASFTITNNGEAPVTITVVQPTCGCTAPNYTKEPIKPGETGTVSLTYDSKISGPFSKSAAVRLNDGQRYNLVIKGEVQKVQ